jgi:hypothetical protein
LLLQKVIEAVALLKDNPCMIATTIAKKRRIRGRKLVIQKQEKTFPLGSLLKYLTPDRDREQLAIVAGCVRGPVNLVIPFSGI